MNPKDLSKFMSLVLRHEPTKFGVVLDAEGYTPLNELLEAIVSSHSEITVDDIINVVENVEPDKKRFTIEGGDIRANYGHSIRDKIEHEIATPPQTLYHGTYAEAVQRIKETGLKPMRRQYVHLTSDYALAARVGARRGKPVVLEIDTTKAHLGGVKFYRANERFWLVDELPAAYIL